jgi:hypothetical protein
MGCFVGGDFVAQRMVAHTKLDNYPNLSLSHLQANSGKSAKATQSEFFGF